MRAARQIDFRISTSRRAEFAAENEHAPPAPTELLARLGLLLAIALGFGLVAQIIVGVPA